MLMRETGMRNARELYRLRVENIDWTNHLVFNPNSKTAKGRRFIPISDRAMEILKRRSGERNGWVFQSRYKGKPIGAALSDFISVETSWSRNKFRYETRLTSGLFSMGQPASRTKFFDVARPHRRSARGCAWRGQTARKQHAGQRMSLEIGCTER